MSGKSSRFFVGMTGGTKRASFHHLIGSASKIPVLTYRHIKDIKQIREEGLQPLPQCQKCGIFQNNVGLRHQQTVSCKKYTMRLALQNANEHNKKVAEEVKFTICGETIEQEKEFRYLARVVSENDNDNKAIIQNLQKTKSTWGVLH